MAEEEFEAEEEPLSPVVLTPPSDPNKRRRKRKVDDLYEEPAKPPRKRKPKASSAVIDEAAAAAAAAEREAALKAKEEAARLAEPPECEDAFDEGIEEVVVEEIPDEVRTALVVVVAAVTDRRIVFVARSSRESSRCGHCSARSAAYCWRTLKEPRKSVRSCVCFGLVRDTAG